MKVQLGGRGSITLIACDAGAAARRAAGETSLNFGEAAPGTIGSHKGETGDPGDPGGVVAAGASPLEGLRRGAGTRSPREAPGKLD